MATEATKNLLATLEADEELGPLPKLDESTDPFIKCIREVTKDDTIKVTQFQANMRLKGTPENQSVSAGLLEYGVKEVHDILQHSWFYTPPGRSSKACDISDSIRRVPGTSQDTTQWTKSRASGLTDWAFDITVVDAKKNEKGETEAAYFTGTMTIWKSEKNESTGLSEVKELEYVWESSNTNENVDKVIVKSLSPISPPAGKKITGSQEGFRAMNPYSWKRVPTTKNGKEEMIDSFTDMAQEYGNKLLNKLMMHALDDTTREALKLGQEQLNVEVEKILKNNRDFLKRAGVALLAQEMRKINEISMDLRKHIARRFEYLVNMMTSFQAPTDPNAVDPVKAYGWDRERNKDDIKKLRKQFSSASVGCYEIGFKQYCKEWQDYLLEPAYWCKAVCAYLLSSDHLIKWRRRAVDRGFEKGVMNVDEEIILWGNKLTLLKDAAPENEAAELNVKLVIQYLSMEAKTAMSFTARLSDHLAQELDVIADGIEKDEKLKKKGEALAKDMDSQAKELNNNIIADSGQLVRTLSDPQHGLVQQIRAWWDRRLPPPLQGGATGPLTIAQVHEAIDPAHGAPVLPPEDFTKLEPLVADVLDPAIRPGNVTTPRPKWTTRLKTSLGKVPWGKYFSGLLRMAGWSFLTSVIVREATDKSFHPAVAEMVMTYSALTAEGPTIAGWGIGKFLTWSSAKMSMPTKLTGWFTAAEAPKGALNAANVARRSLGRRLVGSLAGNIAKVVSCWKYSEGSKGGWTLGLIGTVCMAILAYHDAQEADKITDDKERTKTKAFAYAQFGLAIAEGVLIVGGIIAEVLELTALAAWCGPLAIAVAIIAIVVLVVYYIWFKPDPEADIKSFLNGEAKTYGSFDDTQDFTDKWKKAEEDDKKLKEAQSGNSGKTFPKDQTELPENSGEWSDAAIWAEWVWGGFFDQVWSCFGFSAGDLRRTRLLRNPHRSRGHEQDDRDDEEEDRQRRRRGWRKDDDDDEELSKRYPPDSGTFNQIFMRRVQILIEASLRLRNGLRALDERVFPGQQTGGLIHDAALRAAHGSLLTMEGNLRDLLRPDRLLPRAPTNGLWYLNAEFIFLSVGRAMAALGRISEDLIANFTDEMYAALETVRNLGPALWEMWAAFQQARRVVLKG